MVRAKRSLGQNFLVDPSIQRRIVEALEASPTDEVLEIGPGTGALTRHLAGMVRRLIAIELDDRLVKLLQGEYGAEPGVEIIHANALEVDLDELSDDLAELRVIGNIPYNITTPLIFWLLERPVRPARIVLMIQREVADRILASPGGKEYGALTVGVRSVAQVERLFNVGRGAFRPAPDVDSTVIRIEPLRPPPLEFEEERDLRELTRVTFAWRRKQLQRTLRDAPGYRLSRQELDQLEAETGIDLRLRPESLSPAEFMRLGRELRVAGFPEGLPDRGPDR